MTEITNVMDNLIRRAKRDTRLSDIRFVRAYSNRIAQKAPGCTTVFVELVYVEKRREFFGGLFRDRAKSFSAVAGFNLRLSCGMNGSGEELAEKALILVERLRAEDSEKYIEDYSIGSVQCDRDLGTISRDIRVNIGFVYSKGDL